MQDLEISYSKSTLFAVEGKDAFFFFFLRWKNDLQKIIKWPNHKRT